MPKPVPMPSVTHETRKPKLFVPPFQNGDKMDQKTFHALYEQTPDGFKAELIGGIVYMASPVSPDGTHQPPRPHDPLAPLIWGRDRRNRRPGQHHRRTRRGE